MDRYEVEAVSRSAAASEAGDVRRSLEHEIDRLRDRCRDLEITCRDLEVRFDELGGDLRSLSRTLASRTDHLV